MSEKNHIQRPPTEKPKKKCNFGLECRNYNRYIGNLPGFKYNNEDIYNRDHAHCEYFAHVEDNSIDSTNKTTGSELKTSEKSSASTYQKSPIVLSQLFPNNLLSSLSPKASHENAKKTNIARTLTPSVVQFRSDKVKKPQLDEKEQMQEKKSDSFNASDNGINSIDEDDRKPSWDDFPSISESMRMNSTDKEEEEHNSKIKSDVSESKPYLALFKKIAPNANVHALSEKPNDLQKVPKIAKQSKPTNKFSLCCWHLINDKNDIFLEQIRHNCEEECMECYNALNEKTSPIPKSREKTHNKQYAKSNAQTSPVCPHGEYCCEFKRVFNADGVYIGANDDENYTNELEQSVEHCSKFVHRTLKTKEYYSMIMKEINSPETSDENIMQIMSKPDFDIDFLPTNEENELKYDKLTLEYINAGMYGLLGKICFKCKFETFKFAIELKRSKAIEQFKKNIVDPYTLFHAIAKNDIRYIELLGKEQFNVFSDLSVPINLVESSDPKSNGIKLIRVGNLLNSDAFKESRVVKKISEWNLYK